MIHLDNKTENTTNDYAQLSKNINTVKKAGSIAAGILAAGGLIIKTAPKVLSVIRKK